MDSQKRAKTNLNLKHFKPGNNANPKGCQPSGKVSFATLMRSRLEAKNGEKYRALVDATIASAIKEDGPSRRMILDRFFPVPKEPESESERKIYVEVTIAQLLGSGAGQGLPSHRGGPGTVAGQHEPASLDRGTGRNGQDSGMP